MLERGREHRHLHIWSAEVFRNQISESRIEDLHMHKDSLPSSKLPRSRRTLLGSLGGKRTIPTGQQDGDGRGSLPGRNRSYHGARGCPSTRGSPTGQIGADQTRSGSTGVAILELNQDDRTAILDRFRKKQCVSQIQCQQCLVG